MPYHHGNLRAALVDAAVELAQESGPDAVALRGVARRVGVSHNAAYRHFADRDELMRAVAARIMTRFGLLMAAYIERAATGRSRQAAYDRFEACGRAYVDFATENPNLFRTACLYPIGSVMPDGDVAHPYRQLSERLDELVARKAITPARREHAEIAAYSAVHGFAMLTIDGPLREAGPLARRQGLAEVLRMVREGI